MAHGDVIISTATVLPGEFLDIQPAAGGAWVVHTLFFGGGPWELYYADGTDGILSTAGTDLVRANQGYRVTNDQYIQLRNVDSGAVTLGYSAIQTQGA